MRTAVESMLRSYPSGPNALPGVSRKAIVPLVGAPLVAATGKGSPTDGRRITPSISPMRAAPLSFAGTVIVVAAVSVKGGPLPGVTDTGSGTIWCALSVVRGCMSCGVGRWAVGRGAVVGAVERHAEAASASAAIVRYRERVVILFGGRISVAIARLQ